MSYSMFICSSCRKIYKIRGKQERQNCRNCSDTYLQDMGISDEIWQTMSMSEKQDHVSECLGYTNKTVIKPRSLKLVDLSCPKCGAALQVNPDLQKYICAYCGSELLVQDEINKSRITNGRELGFQQECGRQDAIDSSRESLLRILSEVREPLGSSIRLYDELTAAKKKYNALKPMEERSAIIVGTVIAIVIGIMFISQMGAPGIIFLILALVISPLSFWLESRSTKSKKERLAITCDSLEKQYVSALDQMKGKIDVIPPDYRYPAAVESFYKYVNNRRADNIREAMNLYEEEMHRLRIENAQEAILRETQKQTSLQRQQAITQFLILNK